MHRYEIESVGSDFFSQQYLSILGGSGHLARCYGDHVRMHTEAERRRTECLMKIATEENASATASH